MHYLARVEITNFRSCKDTKIPLAAFTPLVGYNNAGKSNILDAVKWLLRHSALDEHDFQDPETPLTVEGTIEGLTDEVLNSIPAKRRKSLEPFRSENGEVRFRRTQPDPSATKGKIVLEVRRPSFSGDESEAWRKNPSGFEQSLKLLFPEPIEIGAMEDAAEDVAKHKTTTTIGKLVSEIVGPLQETHGDVLRKSLAGLRRQLEGGGEERLDTLKSFDEGANEKISELFPGIKIQTHVPVPSVEDLLKNSTIKVQEEDTETSRDVTALGHGAQRSIQMALVRYLAEQQSSDGEEQARTLLLVDEPELYLHPQAIEGVRGALKALSEQHYQVLFATHSPLMIGERDFPHAVIVRKEAPRSTHVRERVLDAVKKTIRDANSQKKTLLELQNANQILFSDRVLLAEGKTERRVLPAVYEQVAGHTLAASKIALVSMGGTGGICKGLRILNVMNMRGKALADLDFAFKMAIDGKLLVRDDEDLEACRQIHSGDADKLNKSDECVELAANGEARKHIENLHLKLKKQGVWLWKKGAIEQHLGCGIKNEESWADFCISLGDGEAAAVIDDFGEVAAFVKWLQKGE